ncbi:hypothetical protein H0X06_01365 [Candidatus Dependentiae bacterium]|nr:hypothetical protein [Candidatus Dependentiae bacterium]
MKATLVCMVVLSVDLQAVHDKDPVILALQDVAVKLVKKLVKSGNFDKKRKKVSLKAAQGLVRQCKNRVIALEVGRDYAWSTWLSLGTVATFLGIHGTLLVNKNTRTRDALYLAVGAVSFTLSWACYLKHPLAFNRLENACKIEDLIKNIPLSAVKNGEKSEEYVV